MLVDTHCHLNLEQFSSDLDDVLGRAVDAGINHIIVPGVDVRTSEIALELGQTHKVIHPAVGIHPNYAAKASMTDLHFIASLAMDQAVVAIGEIGLDLYRDFAPLPSQQEILEFQLDVASRLNKPVIIHSRNATQELIPILQGWVHSSPVTPKRAKPVFGVMHAFEGSLEEAELFVNQGFVIGIGGAWTYSPSRVDSRLLEEIPISSFLFETDAPYLAPVPFRGKRNEPSFLTSTIKFISSKTGTSFPELCKISTDTSNLTFHLE